MMINRKIQIKKLLLIKQNMQRLKRFKWFNNPGCEMSVRVTKITSITANTNKFIRILDKNLCT